MNVDPLFVSVGARYIQRWITSTPRLRLMRGASLALERVTSQEAVEEWITKQGAGFGGQIEKSGGDASGTIKLRLSDDNDLASVCDALLRHLAQELPSMSWEGWARSAPTYADAVADEESWQRGKVAVGPPRMALSAHPPSSEIGVVTNCPGCQAEPSLSDGIRDRRDDDVWDRAPYGIACCGKYHEWAQVRYQEEHSLPRPDGVFGQRIKVPGRNEAHDLAELASRGGLVGDEAPDSVRNGVGNHLALIQADGNAVGAFFKEIAGSSAGTAAYAAASQALTDTLTEALEAAGRRITPPAEGEPEIRAVEEHFVGGDDLLVSVPARFAWAFVETLTMEFEGHLRPALRTVAAQYAHTREDNLNAAIDAISLAVGMVISHHTYPMAPKQAASEAAMALAKMKGGRSAAWVAFQDLTVDSLGDTHTVSVATLSEEFGRQPSGVFAIGNAARSHLSKLLTPTENHGTLLTAEKAEHVMGLVKAEIKRNGWGLTFDNDVSPKDQLTRLRSDLLRSRWWPDTSTQPTATPAATQGGEPG